MRQIELDDQTAERLALQAAARGMTVGQYVDSLVPPVASGDERSGLSVDLDAELELLVLELPTLPRDFSRADIYDDHD